MVGAGIKQFFTGLFNRQPKLAKRSPSILGRITNDSGYDAWTYLNKVTPAMVLSILRSNSLVDQAELFTAMEVTWPRLLKNLNELKSAVSSIKYRVVPKVDEDSGEPTEQALERAKLVEYALAEFSPNPISTDENGFEESLFDLCGAIGSGLSVLEVLWENTIHGKLPRATAWAHPRNFKLDDSQLVMADGSELDPNRFLIGVGKTRSGGLMTQGLLRDLAWWWTGIMYGREWAMKFAQTFGQPFRYATYPHEIDLSTKTKLDEMLGAMGSSAWGSFPEGIKLEFIEAAKSGGDLPQMKIMEVADEQCDILILGQTLTTSVGASGSRALGDVHYSIREDIIVRWSKWVANILNYQLIPSVLRLNYPDGGLEDCPSIEPDFSKPEDPLVNAQRDTLLLQNGVEMPKVWFYERHGIPLPEPDEDLVSKPAPTIPSVPNQPGNQDQEETEQEQEEPQPEENVQAKQSDQSTDRLLNSVLEDITGVSEKWLAPVKPVFKRLVVMAKDGQVSDEEFISALQKASNLLPELFSHMDHEVLAGAMEKAMGAAMVNGAVSRMTQ